MSQEVIPVPEGDGEADCRAIAEIAGHYEAILRLIGEDPAREGLLKTPMRAARALWYATSGGRGEKPEEIMRKALFSHEGSRMVIVRDIEFYSLCEHHILPFFGTVSVGYIPDGRIVGLSKLARVVNAVARHLQVQERLTAEICRAVENALHPLGVMVLPPLYADARRGEATGRYGLQPLFRSVRDGLLAPRRVLSPDFR